jgi:hypothetical protein
MKKYKYELLGLGILIVGGIYLFKKLKEAKDLANTKQNVTPEVADKKESDIDTIINAGKFNGTRSVLQTFEPSFLNDWARATLNNQSTFTSKSVKYNTQGGKRVTTKSSVTQIQTVYNPKTYTFETPPIM